MLALDSPRWRELDHAYGSAERLPHQLTELLTKQYYGNDPHDVLFGCLCHQGSIYTATYAAVPHCVAAFPYQSLEGRRFLSMFLGAVAVTTDAPPVPAELKADYRAAIEAAKGLVVEEAKTSGVPSAEYAHILAAVAAIHGLAAINHVVEWLLINDEMNGLCGKCHSTFRIFPTQLPLVAFDTAASHAREDEEADPGQGGSPVTPTQTPPMEWDGSIRETNALLWLTALAKAAGQTEIVETLYAAFGMLSCPRCNETIHLWRSAIADFNAELN